MKKFNLTKERLRHYNCLSSDQLKDYVIELCFNLKTEEFIYFCTNKFFKDKISIKIKNEALQISYEKMNIELVKFLLESYRLEEHAEIHYNDNKLLRLAAEKNDLESIKYFLTSPALKDHIDIDKKTKNGRHAFIQSCVHKDGKIAKYLLTSKDLKKNVNINIQEKDGLSGLIYACYWGNLELVKYLLESNELKEHANVNAYETMFKMNSFIAAVVMGEIEVAQYLIDKKDIKIDYRLEECFIKLLHELQTSNRDIMKMVNFLIFNTDLELSENLEKELLKSNVNNRTREIETIRQWFELKKLKQTLNVELDDSNHKKIKKNKL